MEQESGPEMTMARAALGEEVVMMVESLAEEPRELQAGRCWLAVEVGPMM